MYSHFHHDITLSTTFKTKVIAKQHIYIEDVQDSSLLIEELKGRIPLILGGGSNYLFVNENPDLLISITNASLSIVDETKDSITIDVGASYNWHELVLFCLDKGWYGLENLSLIPGTIGAAPVQNIGAYGREISEFVISVSGFDMNTGKYHVFTHSECQFSYRSSYFKTHLKSSFLITSVRLQLYKNPLIKADYPDVQKALLDAHIKNPTPKEISEIIIHIRQSKLPDPLQIGNAGSFFKNPSITEEYYHSLIKRYPGIPSYPQTDGTVKISAAWLIDSCGWKGFREHDIGVHNKQALVLVNYGNGKARDIYHLSMKIQESIKNMYGIFLEPEVNIIL